MGKNQPTRRVPDAELYVDPGARPGWPSGAERTPVPGDEVYCVAGTGVVERVRGRTSDGSLLLEIRLHEEGTRVFYAASSNVLVAPRAA